jgi:hypothetical protein
MKLLKILLAILMTTLSANAEFFFQASFGVEKGEFNQTLKYTKREVGSIKKGIDVSGRTFQLGVGYEMKFENKTFLWVEINNRTINSIKGSNANNVFDPKFGNEISVEFKQGISFITGLGYKIHENFSLYAKLGLGIDKVLVEGKFENFRSEKIMKTDIGGLIFGLGGAYHLNSKSSIYFDFLMKDYKGKGGNVLFYNVDFETKGDYKGKTFMVGYKRFF